MLELAAGTGNLTRIVAPRVGHLTALDASPEVLDINAGKLGSARRRVELVLADLYTWEPRTYDAALFGFWISHVPPDRWDAFWSFVRRCVPPDGPIWFCDSADPELGRRTGVIARPGAGDLSGDEAIDPRTDIAERTLPDGRSFRVVKRFFRPDELALDLGARGFDLDVTTTRWAFLVGRGHRT